MATLRASTTQPAGALRTGWDTIRHSVNWLYLLPALVFFIGYQVYPLIRVFLISFTDYHYIRNDPAHFTGLLNYANALNDPLVGQGLMRAAAFTVMFLPGTIFVPLFLAILVDRVRSKRLGTLYRLILLIPAVIPGPMIFVLWKWLYDFEIGPINRLLVDVLHLFTFRTAPQWLGNSGLTLPAIAIMEVWWGLGYHTMFFLAGLASIPHELFDAARVDGANEWNMFWHVTLPRLQPILLILVVLLQAKGSGFGEGLGGTTSSFRTRRGLEKTLFQATIFLVIIFLAMSAWSVKAT